jgi:formylglycine-generating enzyme required for sulfatase activity/serine/threonine protein kinase
MTPSTLTQTLLASLLDSPAIVEVASQAGEKVIGILREHFTFTAFEINKAYQDGCGYAFVAISVGLDAPDSLLKTLRYPKITREFAAQIETHYWQPFLQANEAVQKNPKFRKETIQTLKRFAKKTEHLFEIQTLTEEELSALVSHRQNLAITDIVLDQMQGIETLDEDLKAFLRFDGLLGDSVLFFFRELIRQDPRLKDTQNALQQEHICLKLEDIQEAIADLKGLQEKSSFLFDPHKLQHLETIEAAWQTHIVETQRFQNRFENKIDNVLDWVQDVDTSLAKLDEKLDEMQQTGVETKDLVELIAEKLDDLLAQRGLSNRVKPGDELRPYDNESLSQIDTWVKQLGRLPSQHPLYSQVSLKMGTALSSTGELEKAEQFFLQTIEKTNSPDEKRLAYFNLFQVRWRYAFSQNTVADKTAYYAQALIALKNAVKKSEAEIEQGGPKIDQRYALHDINKGYYPYEKMLGAGGMGCAFLCHNQNQLTATQHPLVVVKCFWENLTGRLDSVFKEPFTLNQVASDTVPLALDYGYTDSLKQQGPYFVTEYIEGAIDGEAWLETQGPLDFQDGQQIALQIAEGLQRAHEQGIYHLDLKPANLLLKREQDRLVVKIIDFGLARIAPSLRDQAEQRSRTRSLSAFGQAIFGTWEYAPPEQQGFARDFGKPTARSDLFAFGKTLYRLLTGKVPLQIEQKPLAKTPEWYKLLSHCTLSDPAERPQSAKEVIGYLQALKPNKPVTPKKSDGMAEDDKAWQIACEQNTLEAYQAYLKGHTLKRQAHLAQMRIQVLEQEADEAAWQWTCHKNSRLAYQAYLEGNTRKQHADKAKKRLKAYAQKQDDQAWQKACQQDNKAAYQAYLNGNTLKTHREEAQKRTEDEEAWAWTCQKDSQMGYQAYLNGNTLKRHSEQAKQRLIKKAQAADEQAWQTATQQDSQAAYQTYLNGNTLKQHTEEAQERLKALDKAYFEFEIVTVNAKGEITQREEKRAQYLTEDLGNGVLLEMVYIPGGTFMMGSPKTEKGREAWNKGSESPQHQVTVKPFLMGKYPITQAQWQAVMGKNPSHFKGDNRPVEMVSWHDCVEFCKRLYDKTGKAYRLPSEAEWEYACRAGTTTPFYFGETITTDLANYDGDFTYASGPSGVYRGETTDVGSFPPNAFGLYDMHGNVWEWCADLWHGNYEGAPTSGSAWLENKSDKGNLEYLIISNVAVTRLPRGGSFDLNPLVCRAALRDGDTSVNHNGSIGFRGCADLEL